MYLKSFQTSKLSNGKRVPGCLRFLGDEMLLSSISMNYVINHELTLGIQSYFQMMTGVYNHHFRKVFNFILNGDWIFRDGNLTAPPQCHKGLFTKIIQIKTRQPSTVKRP